MAKLKRLATLSDNLVTIKSPVTKGEVESRNNDYPILTPMHFAKKYNNLFKPVNITFQEKTFQLQFNYCDNPFCKWFGQPQKKFNAVPNKPSRYRLSGRGKGRKQTIICNPDPEDSPGKTHDCTTSPFSNWGIAEEIKRLYTNDKVKDIEPDYVFHKDGCLDNEQTPFNNKKQFYKRGKSSGNSQKWQCKTCGKITNVLPNRTEKFTYNQKRNDIMPSFAKSLLNRTPVSRTCESLGIAPKTYYHKLEWLYRRCLEFLERYESKPLQNMEFSSIWLNTDKMIYNLNNVRKRGQGGIRHDNTEDKLMQTHVIISGDINSNYIFRSDLAYDWDTTLDDVLKDTETLKEDHLHEFNRKNDRLRFSVAPQPPTNNDNETEAEYLDLLNEFNRRRNYIDGLHTNSTYTTFAHLWLIKQMLHADKWRLVTDDDASILQGVYRVFKDEISNAKAHHFITQLDRSKSLQDAYQEYKGSIENLKSWGQSNGHNTRSLRQLAFLKLSEELKIHHFHKTQYDGIRTYNVWAKNPIEPPLATIDKGYFTVDVTTDLSSYDADYIANLILKVSDRPTNVFMQIIRRRLSILERPLVTARGDGKSYIYANFNPKYAQYALTILRTYYNFCHTMKVHGGLKLTPAQQLGITDKVFDMKDIIYFK